jgi:hypothetical protein
MFAEMKAKNYIRAAQTRNNPIKVANKFIYFFLLLPLWSIELISSVSSSFTDGRTPWTGDQLVARQ